MTGSGIIWPQFSSTYIHTFIWCVESLTLGPTGVSDKDYT